MRRTYRTLNDDEMQHNAKVGLFAKPSYLKGEKCMSVQDKVIKIVVEKLDVDKDEVVPKASLVDDLGADSLDLVELVMTMEEEFDLEISDEEAESLVTIQDAINFIEARS